jgi:hypothetical protein
MELTVWPAATKCVIGELSGASVYFHTCRRGNNSITGVGAPLALQSAHPEPAGSPSQAVQLDSLLKLTPRKILPGMFATMHTKSK